VAHSEFDPRIPSADELQAIKQAAPRGRSNPLIPARVFPVNGWKIVESVPSVAPFGGQAPIVFKTRISSNGADDVMVLNGPMGQMAVVSHPDVKPGDTTFTPAQVSIRPYAGSPVAALPERINIDGRPGVIALHAGQVAPAMMMPLPDPTFLSIAWTIPPRGDCHNLQ